MLRPRERRPPRMPNQTSQLTAQRMVAFSHGNPGLGPRRIMETRFQVRWGGIVISPNGVWGLRRRHGLNRRIIRMSLVAGYAAPPEPERRPRSRPATSWSTTRGELVGFDCFDVGAWAPRPAASGTHRDRPRDLLCLGRAATTALNPSAQETSAWRAGWQPTCGPTAGAWSAS